MDACIWLLQNGVTPARIRWIMPRDAWMLDRSNFQPSAENFERSIGSIIGQFEAIAEAPSIPDLFERLGERGLLLRIDKSVEPGMYRCAVVSQAELEQLRRIKDVVRLGRLRSVERTKIVLDLGATPASDRSAEKHFLLSRHGQDGQNLRPELVSLIEDIQDKLPCYGYRRVTRELCRRGRLVNHKRVARVMRAADLGIKPRKRYVRTTDSNHDSPIYPNPYRNVIPAGPTSSGLPIFAYIRIPTGFCYLAVILDACSRKVVGYALSRRLDTLLALAALRSAIASRRPPPRCIHHTDRGRQYASETYRKALDEAGLRDSMSAIGNPYHNDQAESFMKTLKVEDVYVASYERAFPMWPNGCRGSSSRSTTRRLHSAVGYRTPEKFETQHTQKAA